MTRVAILPVTSEQGRLTYRAVAGTKQSRGDTAGAALDALTAQMTDDEAGTLVVVQSLRPDRFFGAAQRQRLAALMGQWRGARDAGTSFPPDLAVELEALVDAEVTAAGARAAALADESGR
jgi:hypothetical protein